MNPRRVRHASSRGRDLRDLRDKQRPRRCCALRVVVFDVGERDVVVEQRMRVMGAIAMRCESVILPTLMG